MPRTPDARAEQAKAMFLSGQKLIDIASALGVPEGTVRSWKNRYRWDDGSATLQRQAQRCEKKRAVAKEVELVIENQELTDEQQLFCLYYVRCFNATKAYQKAYGVSLASAMACGSRLLKQKKIQAQIKELKQNRLTRELLQEEDIFQRMIDIAFADMNDYAIVQNGVVMIKNTKDTDGSLIQEISQGKAGTKVKLLDKMQATKWLFDHMDQATERQKAELELLKAQIALTNARNPEREEEEAGDDGFLDALNGTAAEDWADEEN